MKYLILVLSLILLIPANAQVSVGAERLDTYLPLIIDKKVALIVNPSSLVGEQHLVDLLLENKVEVIRIMAPEHGFRGKADAGEYIKDGIDAKTGLPIVSLYGKHKKPYKEDVADVDFVIFDLQDVGTRFYTYISTLQYVMEACAEHGTSVLVLDRPNPNGHYVDGPVLKPEFKSFVGMQEIPIVHGMTVAEYANMLNQEGLLENGIKCDLHWVTCTAYDHRTNYSLPVRPSPNLPNDTAIALYPSLCLFEGTKVSVGRGTNFPFQVVGHPDHSSKLFKEDWAKFYFIPKPNEGSKHPKLEGEECYGKDLRGREIYELDQIELELLISFYNNLGRNGDFFISFFEKLAGTDELRKQIESGMSASEIRSSWKKDLKHFKETRKKYLLYKDWVR